MIWFTWRQTRTQTMITAVALAALGVLLLATISTITSLYAPVAVCKSDCEGAISTFLVQFEASTAFPAYLAAVGAMYLLPLLLGIFGGAPMIARELESGTHRLVWNQSVTRTRWLAMKLAAGAALSVGSTGLLSWAVTMWSQRIDSASQDRMIPLLFGSRGVVPVAYALFAFVLGVTAGMLLRKVVPAIAVTLAVYIGAVVAMPLWIRAHLISPVHETIALNADKIQGLSLSPDTGQMTVTAAETENAWTVANKTILSDGSTFTGPADLSVCGPEAPLSKCQAWLGSLNLRQDLLYHPTSHFWPLQWAEAGVFIGLSVLLGAFCFWWVRRRIV
ncbi:MAG: ABC transporter permease [Hamadaea sp.]|uniref:ABC transporter permease n=1 Tax=Hamadaea sp. TaxID=2024425 RepID=UPI00178D916F|nr:ABC transporter permease [Hamadaea sp.]NUR70410.1 ABC transporter permease [Hamadaea sp.]NUT20000.1 ABC transporter permease [Hamadaea sp.]